MRFAGLGRSILRTAVPLAVCAGAWMAQAAKLAHAPAALYVDATIDQTAHGVLEAGPAKGSAPMYRIAEEPHHGTAVLDKLPSGSWAYTPQKGFIGNDEFRVSTNKGAVVRLVILVNYEPTRKTYYADAVNGSDKNDGSLAKPFATIQAASDISRPGDTILIRNGTYKETSVEAVVQITRSGSPGAVITYKAYPGEHPVLHAEKAWNHILINASYIRIEGLEVAGNAQNLSIADAEAIADRFMKGPAFQTFGPETAQFETNGIFARPVDIKVPMDRRIAPRHLQFIDNYVHDCPGGGIVASFSDYVTIAKNRIERNVVRCMYAGSGVSLLGMQNTDDVQPLYKNFVANNTLVGNETKVKWAKTKEMSDGNGIIMDSNRNTEPGGVPYAGRTLIANNVVSESGGAGIQVFATDNVDVVFNTMYRNSLTPELHYAQILCHAATNVRIENNIAFAGEGEKINEQFKDTANVVYDYNIYFGGLKPEIVGPHDVIADPKFMNAETHDFRLLADSPAIDSAVAGFGIAKDNAGDTRPSGKGYDRGAFEFQIP